MRGRVYQPWQEAVEREIVCDDVASASARFAHFLSIRVRRTIGKLNLCTTTVAQSVAVIVREWERVRDQSKSRPHACSTISTISSSFGW